MRYEVQIFRDNGWLPLARYDRCDESRPLRELTWETDRDNAFLAVNMAFEYYETDTRVVDIQENRVRVEV